MFPPPFDSLPRRNARGGDEKGAARSSLRRLVRKEIFGKCVDGTDGKILAETLSLLGKLFEIYFVRLIGTPNQNSKNGAGFGRYQVK